MIALCIAGAMGAVVVPIYQNATKTAKGSEARVNLNTFFLGQKIYRANNGKYWTPSTGVSVETINKTLGVNVSPAGYPTFAYSGGDTSYQASFAEQSDATHKYSINDVGTLTETMPVAAVSPPATPAAVPPSMTTAAPSLPTTNSKTTFLET